MDDRIAETASALRTDPQFATSLGLFLVAFSRCENETNQAVCGFLGLQGHTGGPEVVFAIRDFGQRIVLLSRLGKVLTGTPHERGICSDLCSALSFINENRVDLVHGEFSRGSAQGAMVSKAHVKDREIAHKHPQFTTEYVLDLADYAMSVENSLTHFRIGLRKGDWTQQPSLGTRPERPA